MTREEIAERLRANATGDLHRELADAVRALPVLATCSECGWRHLTAVRGGTAHECEHPRLTIENANVRPYDDGGREGQTMTTWTHNGEWHWNLRRDDLGLVPLALWEIDERRRRETVRAVVALLTWGLS